MSETPIPLVKQQLQYHLDQTFVQQDRLRTIITNLGGSPTSAKAALPKMLPTDMDTVSNTVKETAKSLVSSKSKDRVDAEHELIQTKQDAIIENAEIVTYKMLMEISQKVGLLEALPLLQQSLLEETAMENFIVSTTPMALTMLWPELMFDIPRLYLSACSNSVQLVPLHPIIMSILFHHYKELIQLVPEVEQMEEEATIVNIIGKKKKELTIEEGGEEKEQTEEELPLQSQLFDF